MTSRFAPNQTPKSGQYVGKDKAGEDYGTPERGSVSNPGRWWSLRWWVGHHWKRRPGSGEFAPDTSGAPRGYVDTSGREWAPVDPALLRRRAGSERDSSRDARDYRAYLESRYDAAESATRGHMVNAAGRRRGISARRTWFSGRQGSTAYATDEMRDWLEANGPTLTATAYRAQHRGPTRTVRTARGHVQVTLVRKRAA